GLYFTWKNARTSQETLRVTEEGKLTERFSKAVEMLGSEKLDVRLGGIYALERIASDSQKDHWTVMEVLTAFVREHSKVVNPTLDDIDRAKWQDMESDNNPVVSTDIQAIMTVIGRRKWRNEEEPHQRLDLRGTDLRGAVPSGAHLEGASLSNSRLECAVL